MASARLISLTGSLIGVALLLPSVACTDVRHVGTVGAGDGPIQVLVWNNALAYGHASRVTGISDLVAREQTDNIHFDLAYAHTVEVPEVPPDTSFDASVFTDAGLDRYDVVLFLNTTGTTIDDDLKDTRRQALRAFIEKKGRGFVGTHSATDTYQDDTWTWYVDFIGANYMSQRPSGPYVPGVLEPYQGATHPILTAAATPNPWNRSDEWFVFTREPSSSPIPGIKVLLTARDQQTSTERPSVWIHEMPVDPSAPRGGRLFYTACCHDPVTFKEPKVIDLIVAGIKWAAYRL